MPVHALSGLPSRSTPRSRLTGGFAVDIRLEILAIYPLLDIIVRSDTWHRGRWLQSMLTLALKANYSVGRLLAHKPSLVNEMVVMPTKHDEVVQTRFTAIRPMFYVVPVDKSGVGTARTATAFVSCA